MDDRPSALRVTDGTYLVRSDRYPSEAYIIRLDRLTRQTVSHTAIVNPTTREVEECIPFLRTGACRHTRAAEDMDANTYQPTHQRPDVVEVTPQRNPCADLVGRSGFAHAQNRAISTERRRERSADNLFPRRTP